MRFFLYGFLLFTSLNVKAERYGNLYEEAFAPDVPLFVQIPLDEINIDVPANYAAILTPTSQSGYVRGLDVFYYTDSACSTGFSGGNPTMAFPFTATTPFYVNPAGILEIGGTGVQSILFFLKAASTAGGSGTYATFSGCTHPVHAQACCYQVSDTGGIYHGTDVGNFTY